MRIAYIGNFRPEFSTENDIRKSLEHLNHEVVKIQEDQHDIDGILKLAVGSDLLLYTRTWGINGDEDVLRLALKELGITTASVHLDLYWGLRRAAGIGNSFFWKTDYVFSADGGHQEEFKKKGINHFWLPPAILEDSCFIAKPDRKKYPHDIIFVGSWKTYHPEHPYRKQMVEFLTRTYGNRFRAYGHTETIRGKELNILYASARVVVGDSIDSPYYWSDRVPETLGRGGFLLFPTAVGLEAYFKPEIHYREYSRRNLGELKNIIDESLNNDFDRKAISTAGLLEVEKNHTYKHRCKEMLDIIYAK